jgi:hypothetical protein
MIQVSCLNIIKKFHNSLTADCTITIQPDLTRTLLFRLFCERILFSSFRSIEISLSSEILRTLAFTAPSFPLECNPEVAS